jgi:translation initiation factor IF-1
MSTNKLGGNKARKGKKEGRGDKKQKELPLAELSDNSYVGIVEACLGDCRFTVQILTTTTTSKSILCHLSKGKKKLGRIVKGTYVLFSIRPFEEKGDIIYVYNADEVKQLEKMGEIVENAGVKDGSSTTTGFEFTSGMGGDENVEISVDDI